MVTSGSDCLGTDIQAEWFVDERKYVTRDSSKDKGHYELSNYARPMARNHSQLLGLDSRSAVGIRLILCNTEAKLSIGVYIK
jgi:hypothetical protein